MAYDGKILARARDILEQIKLNNETELNRRRAEIYELIPEIKKIETEITTIMTGVAVDALKKGLDAGSAVENARSQCDILLEKRTELLKSAGYPADYIDEIFSCSKCRDKGYILGKPCTCLDNLYKAEAVRELSSMLNIEGQSFENFDLSYYEKTPASGGTSPYQIMSTVLSLCRDYAYDFGKNSVNLLFRGGTGLGKTFLSVCIARVVSEKGYSVVYDTAVSVMEAFEAHKFDRGGADSDNISVKVRRYLDCDLLILDDLGTEMTTNFTLSALYTLINNRLLSGGKTIITTNLSEDDIRKRYSPQIVSRLEGEYILLNFSGSDIRRLKRERGFK
ncbi:MAG: ATP-binding protein [Clostridiales bacterium]|nr:ATP-binding protein [Clostridiales bacterium]